VGNYNTERVRHGHITEADLSKLTSHWQRHHKLTDDGLCGPLTTISLRTLDASIVPTDAVWPLPVLTDGRKPLITSGHAHENTHRPNHFGVDIMYQRSSTDGDLRVGDGEATRQYFVPRDVRAVAFAGGTITYSSKVTTGWRLWIHHGKGFHTGYFHLVDSTLTPGHLVERGEPLGYVGHAPNGDDPRHLHFEMYFGDIGAYPKHTLNPRLYLASATWAVQ